jgi:hypothetical protein
MVSVMACPGWFDAHHRSGAGAGIAAQEALSTRFRLLLPKFAAALDGAPGL